MTMEFMPKRKSLMTSMSLQKKHRKSKLSLDSPSGSPMAGCSTDGGRVIDSDNEIENIPVSHPATEKVLKDVVAYVEVRTKSENRSNSVMRQLELLGALVVKKFTNDEPVTHVIWKDGKKSTKDKAIKRGLHLVSVLWVDSCKQNQERASESLFPVTDGNDSGNLVIPKTKRMRSMQPKSFEDDLESSTERMVRKRKKKDLIKPTRLYINSPAGAVIKPFVYVEETQEPYTPVGTPVPGVGGTPSLIPDTPASMRACLDALSRVRNTPRSGSSEKPVSEKPVVGESPTFGGKPEVRQKKLSFSPSVDSKSSGDNIGNKAASKKQTKKKGRRSEVSQRSTIKESTKVRRLSLRIEKSLREEDIEQDISSPEKNKPKGSEISRIDPVEIMSSPNQKITTDTSKPSPTGEIKMNEKMDKQVVFCEREVDSQMGNRQRKRKLLSVNTDAAPSQFITEPTKSSKKERQDKRSRLTGKTSRSLSDKFDKASFTVAHQSSTCDSQTSVKTDDDVRLEQEEEAEEKVLESGRGSRKRKKDNLSSGSSEEDLNKLAKRIKEDEDAMVSMTAFSQQGDKDTTIKSRRSLDDFSLKKRRHSQLKTTKPKPPKGRPASVSTLSTSVKESASKTSQKTIKKPNRSQSLTGDSTTREKEELSDKLPGFDSSKKGRTKSDEMDSSSDSSSTDSSSAGMATAKPNDRSKLTKTTKKPKSGIQSLVMTSVHGSDQDLITSVVKKLRHFRMEDDVSVTTTHVICGENRRTLNVLRGIVRGCWLLSMEWVLKSLEAGHWLPEEPFEIHDPFPAAEISRRARCTMGTSYKLDLLSTLGPIYVHKDSCPPRPCLTELIELCGGSTCSSDRQASLCIGGGDQTQAQSVSEKWLLDCITHHKLLPLQEYSLD